MVKHYKCPGCGADMAYDIKSGKLLCSSCGISESIEQFPKENITETLEESMYENSFSDAKEYQCNNCGAVLITSGDTAATTCSFCGAGVVLIDRLSGHLEPAKVIPFSISKEQAQAGFIKWCRNGLLTPKDFMTADRIKSISGMYVPFWLYDLNGLGEANATCTRVRSYSKGDYDYRETSYYEVYRSVNVNYKKIPVDASIKMDDKLMDKLEPYHYEQLKDFNTPYLAGYIAEKYNYDEVQSFPRVESRANKYVETYIRDTIHGYSSTNIHSQKINIVKKNAYYTLLPVWMVCYDYQQKEHIFAMNGQTGKIVGKPPISKSKMAVWFTGISTAVFLALNIMNFIRGVF